jgi:hypothetical protein
MRKVTGVNVKISLKELMAAVEHIQKNSNDLNASVRIDGQILKIVVGANDGRSLIEYDLYDEGASQHAKVRQSKELCLK